jgi:septum formation protein
VERARVVLASASPRRRALLQEAGVEFEVVASDVDESVSPELSPEDAACVLAERKAKAVAAKRPGVIVLAADTIVAVGGERDHARGPAEMHRASLLGKPLDPEEARAMLRALSGTRHRVITGVCALSPRGRAFTGFERTWVTMRRIEPAEIEAYVESNEWRDKAGGYAIQENADRFVTKLEEGGFDNVVGLPVALAKRLLALAGAGVGS